MSRFSHENLYQVLRQVTHWVDSNQQALHKHATKVAFKIKSINQLKGIVGDMNEHIKRKAVNEDTIFKNYELFLNNLLHLKDLKKYFEDEIYKQLFKYYCEPSWKSIIRPNSQATHRSTIQHRETIKSADDDSECDSQIETNDNRISRKFPHTQKGKHTNKIQQAIAVAEGNDIKCKQIMEEMTKILSKWEGLLTEDDLNVNDFDPEIYHELMRFSSYSQFEAILRLVPDIFAKCLKCIDLAKSLLKLSNVSTNIPEQQITSNDNNTIQETEDNVQMIELQQQIELINKAIANDEQVLQKCINEMEILLGRDERFSTVASKVELLNSLLLNATAEYKETQLEQFEIASKLKSINKETSSYAHIKSNLKRLDIEVAEHHWKVKRLQYERIMVQEDLSVEAEVRPSLIFFLDDTKEKIRDAQRFLQAKKEEKLKLEKQMALLKTNTETTRQIMRTYLGSESEKYPISKSSASSLLSTPSYDLRLSNKRLDDGNEADTDSPKSADGASSPVYYSSQTYNVDSPVALKPKLKKHIRPIKEKSEINRSKQLLNFDSHAKFCTNSITKTSPRRVWENV